MLKWPFKKTENSGGCETESYSLPFNDAAIKPGPCGLNGPV